MSKDVPIGIRLNNPGNLEWGSPWQGMVPRKESKYANSDNFQQARFAQFKSPVWGIRALAKTLITYQDKYGIRTVSAAISRWAPSSENVTSAYIKQVQKAVGGDMVDMHDYASLRPLVEAIIRHENDSPTRYDVTPTKTINEWFDLDTIDYGLKLAGVVPPNNSKVPVTKETVGASATGAVGALELAEVIPSVVTAVKGSEDHLNSGQIVRVVIGLVLIAAAVFIAYAQVKKHKAGTL